jgi:hypothetical protein
LFFNIKKGKKFGLVKTKKELRRYFLAKESLKIKIKEIINSLEEIPF